ncbi:FAD-dependent oxidoreductase [Actinokineospora soli]|uniref:FAD-dependent oxidoreductase n=1 Tax=Actinokineospora soli TaxID=1048753 RepID=A0ABW2TT31_9PSEU
MWDVVVVGAGPAGSAAALSALRRDPSARVLVLDAADFPGTRCAGTASRRTPSTCSVSTSTS